MVQPTFFWYNALWKPAASCVNNVFRRESLSNVKYVTTFKCCQHQQANFFPPARNVTRSLYSRTVCWKTTRAVCDYSTKWWKCASGWWWTMLFSWSYRKVWLLQLARFKLWKNTGYPANSSEYSKNLFVVKKNYSITKSEIQQISQQITAVLKNRNPNIQYNTTVCFTHKLDQSVSPINSLFYS